MRIRAILAYDGTHYLGFQRQAEGVPTVQGVVEEALMRICGQHVTVIGAGRTDAGVHASGQVIAFDLPTWAHGEAALLRALNANLPPDVGISALAQAAPRFHPRFDAQSRTYTYTIVCAPHPLPLHRHTAWVVNRQLNFEQMQRVCAFLEGRRDYGALGTPPQGESTTRTITHATWERTADGNLLWLRFRITADAFLYRMVRRTVGMCYDVGRGKLSPEDFREILERAQVASNVTIAPPQGLVLTAVAYTEHEQQRVSDGGDGDPALPPA